MRWTQDPAFLLPCRDSPAVLLVGQACDEFTASERRVGRAAGRAPARKERRNHIPDGDFPTRQYEAQAAFRDAQSFTGRCLLCRHAAFRNKAPWRLRPPRAPFWD